IELLRQIKKSKDLKDIIVVLVTGQGNIKGAIESMRIGAYDYLLKPINVKELALIIEKIDEYITLKKEHMLLTKNFKMQLDEATKEIKKEHTDLKKAFIREIGLDKIGIFSNKLSEAFNAAQRLHNNPDIPVLIEGETGTGKEVIARFIHYGKGDITKPFIGVNCAAISPTLFESELFGYEAGAFTGGNPKGQKGKLEMAEEGTLFLDEILELPINFQAKILRVLQEREYYRIGGLKKYPLKCRMICATNKNVKDCLKDNSFREDLYFRLSVGHIIIPPLRERKEEIFPLVEMFLHQLREQNKTNFIKVSNKAKKILEEYSWPGNIREIKNTIERISLHWNDNLIKPEHLEFILYDYHHFSRNSKISNVLSISDFNLPENGLDLNKLNLEIVRKALIMTKWNQSKTMNFLGLSRSVIRTYIKNLKKFESE
ncbi:sigma-54-dependent transcriptional regulator, partial [candidate division KSB1 bacterium]